MNEQIEILNDGGTLALKGGELDSALYLNGTPIQLTWVREYGSTWRFQIAKSISEEDFINDNKFKNFVKYGFLSSDPLSVQFDHILNKLDKGRYSLEIKYLAKDIYRVNITSNNGKYFHLDTYAGGDHVIETQSIFNDEIVASYEELINSGAEPIIVVLTSRGSKNKFILDGHHKLAAYLRQGKQPKALVITLLTIQPVSKEEGLAIMRFARSQNGNYKNWFLEKY